MTYEVNPYDYSAGTLKGLLHSPSSPPLDPNEIYIDELVYEMHPSSTLIGEMEIFHFALATGRHKDNRIPPKGFDIANADQRLATPVYYVGGVDVGAAYFTQAEFDGGYDEVWMIIGSGADFVEVNLYYQTTSREYIEFLRDEINGIANTLPGSAYIIQTDPFFDQLRSWGDTIWSLWTHNMNLDGAAPFLMTQATSREPTGCSVSAPETLSATPGHTQVTLDWSGVGGATGYIVYYDQAGKSQLVADAGNSLTYLDTGLTNGVEYCYKITAYDETCESGFSTIQCTVPTNQGQATDPAGVSTLETGIYTGKGKSKTYSPQTTFNAGDSVVIRAYVLDGATGLPLIDAPVDLLISGPEGVSLVTTPKDADGMAEAIWQTKSPGKRNPGTTPGTYTVTVKGITANGYHWDGITTSVEFIIQ